MRASTRRLGAAAADRLSAAGRWLLEILALYGHLSGPMPQPPPQFYRSASRTGDEPAGRPPG